MNSIPFGKPCITDAEQEAVLAVMASGQLTHGPQGHAFEREFELFLGGDAHCVALSSGMAALHLAYWQLGVGPGDEVIVTAQTHVATAHAVEAVGARPVFADCEPVTGNIDPTRIAALITPRTKAIGLVHFLGIPCRMDEILSLARQHDLLVIEDCALAVGARYGGTHVGLLGDAGIFSFYPVKHITTGDGGMFVSRHTNLAARVAKARAFGVDRTFDQRAPAGIYDVPTLGLNYRMSDINAAIGRKQLERIGANLEARGANFVALREALRHIDEICVLDASCAESQSAYYCLSFVLEGRLRARRNEMAEALKKAGIGTSVYYPHPVPRLAYYREKYGYNPACFPQAARISDQSIALPVAPHVGPSGIAFIGETVSRVVAEMLG